MILTPQVFTSLQVYRCKGFCGEPCPQMCPNCDMSRVCSEVADLVDSVPDYSNWVTLWDCGHTLPVNKCCFITAIFLENVAFRLCYSTSHEASGKSILHISMASPDLETDSC